MIKPLLLLPMLALATADIKPVHVRPAAEAEAYSIDTTHSQVVFKCKHFGVSNNYGRFNDITGKFTFDDKDASKCSIEMEVKTESVDTNLPDRDKHLRSGDFLNAKQFPSVTFKSKTIKSTGKDAYEVTGDFTLLGVTKAITVTATHIGGAKDPMGSFRRGFELAFTIKRSEYGMKKMLEGIGDDVHLMINVEGIRQDKK
jgi:polyisoprenoid-binding protein YceI